MALPLLILLASAGVIYLACELFVNGVEWIGHRFDVGQKATGTILAAFGTALPESVVTLVAVAFGVGAAQKQIGVGAALGGPLVLSTVAYAVVGWTLFAARRPLRTANTRADFRGLSRDQAWFLVIFMFKLGVGLIAFAWKPWLGIAFLAAYAVYVWQEARGEQGEAEGELEPLKFAPRAEHPPTVLAVLQTTLAIVVIFFASKVFVGQIEVLGHSFGLKPQLLALLLSPIATELPETLNAIIWVRQGKIRLALANISGAMMIQATVPSALGIFFTPWLLDPALVVAGGVTLVAIVALFIGFRTGRMSRGWLSAMAAFYVAFIGALVAFRLA
ncbi:MAG TPA: sodium:calcium antiporter [Caulobacteraceae bacterium]|jgi:cation:H+ antiporter